MPPAPRPLHGGALVVGVGLEHQVADAILRVGVGQGPEKREAAALAVDAVLAGREGDVPP